MAVNLRNRSFCKELDFTPDQLRLLIGLGADLKRAKSAGTERPRLGGKRIVLVFEKATRTRCAFEVAAYDQGAHVTYLGPTGTHIGHEESIRDTARVLGRIYDGIAYRGFGQEVVETLAADAGVPVWNGLTDQWHPTQMLADMLTMSEHASKQLHEIAYCYLGDARNNTGHSCWSPARCWAWTSVSPRQGPCGRPRSCSPRPARSPPTPAPASPSPTASTTPSEPRTACTPSRRSWSPPWGTDAVRVVAALGGNALLARGERPGAQVQERHAQAAVVALSPLAHEHELVVTHGNGPQVGLLALESAADPALSQPYPFDVLGAQTQGMIGYWLLQALQNALPGRQIAAVISQTLVSAADPAFADPTKFVGPVYAEDDARRLAAERGWSVRRHFGTADAEPVGHTTPGELRRMRFPAGSMGPKVEAVCRFVELTGNLAAIGALGDAPAILAGTTGTVVTPSGGQPRHATPSTRDRQHR